MKHKTRPLTQAECRSLSTKCMKISSGYQLAYLLCGYILLDVLTTFINKKGGEKYVPQRQNCEANQKRVL